MNPERRENRRLQLTLPVATTRVPWPSAAPDVAWTRDISSGGMYIHLPTSESPEEGLLLSFQMAVPAGEGYSTSPGVIRGTGCVVRTEMLAESQVGVAVKFTKPLTMEF